MLHSPASEDVLVARIELLLHSAPGPAADDLIKQHMQTPFSADQRISALEHGGYQLRATVPYTRELVWALQGQAHLLRVVAPADLRQELERFAVLAAAHYGQPL